MKNIKTFENFITESIKFGSYTFTNRTSFSGFDDLLPAKGESVYCVFLHNLVEINGQETYLGQSHGLSQEIVGLYAEEADAKAAYDQAIKSKKTGHLLSVSMGTLTSKSKFQFNYEELAGYKASGSIK